MGIFRPRGTAVLFALAVFVICLLPTPSKAKSQEAWQSGPGSAVTNQNTAEISPIRLVQSNKRLRIAVFTFNILNLGAAGYDATISNLFMTLLDRHNIFEVMSRKGLEESLWRARLQQSGDGSLVRKAGMRLGLDMIIFGNVKKVGSSIEFEVKLIEMAGGRTILHRKEAVFGHVALRSKVEEITRDIVQISHRYQPQVAVVQEQASIYPEPPNGLQARGGSHKVILSWKANKESNLRGYKVFRSVTPKGPFSKVGNVTQNTFTDTALENNQTYYYKVQAFNQENRESPTSVVIAAETAPTPCSPIILGATPYIGSVRIRWTTNPRKGDDGTEVSGFKIYRATDPEGPYHVVASIPVDSGSRRKLKKYKYKDSGLKDGSKYYYRLTAFNDRQIESDFSSSLEGSTVGKATGIQATGDMIREIHLQWHPTPFSKFEGYRIYRNTSPEGTFKRIGEVRGKDKTSYIDQEGLGDATTYFYRVTVYDKEGGETGLSQTSSAVTRGKPPTPEGLTAESGLVKNVRISWKVRPEKEVEGYCIYWNSNATGEFKRIAKVKGRKKTSFVDKGDRDRPFDDNSTYFYTISSYNKVDVNSEPSPMVEATTKPRPQAPAGLTAQGGLPAKIVLAWQPNPEPDIKYFHVFRQQTGKKFKEIKKLPPDKTQYEDDKLDHGTTYIYRLQAEDKDKLLSGFSVNAEATTKPLPEKPTGLEVRAIPNGFELAWKSNSEPDINTYKIYLESFMTQKEIGSTEKNFFTTSTLDADKEYSIAITAVDRDGLESKKSEAITVRTLGE